MLTETWWASIGQQVNKPTLRNSSETFCFLIPVILLQAEVWSKRATRPAVSSLVPSLHSSYLCYPLLYFFIGGKGIGLSYFLRRSRQSSLCTYACRRWIVCGNKKRNSYVGHVNSSSRDANNLNMSVYIEERRVGRGGEERDQSHSALLPFGISVRVLTFWNNETI